MEIGIVQPFGLHCTSIVEYLLDIVPTGPCVHHSHVLPVMQLWDSMLNSTIAHCYFILVMWSDLRITKSTSPALLSFTAFIFQSKINKCTTTSIFNSLVSSEMWSWLLNYIILLYIIKLSKSTKLWTGIIFWKMFFLSIEAYFKQDLLNLGLLKVAFWIRISKLSSGATESCDYILSALFWFWIYLSTSFAPPELVTTRQKLHFFPWVLYRGILAYTLLAHFVLLSELA